MTLKNPFILIISTDLLFETSIFSSVALCEVHTQEAVYQHDSVEPLMPAHIE